MNVEMKPSPPVPVYANVTFEVLIWAKEGCNASPVSCSKCVVVASVCKPLTNPEAFTLTVPMKPSPDAPVCVYVKFAQCKPPVEQAPSMYFNAEICETGPVSSNFMLVAPASAILIG